MKRFKIIFNNSTDDDEVDEKIKNKNQFFKTTMVVLQNSYFSD